MAIYTQFDNCGFQVPNVIAIAWQSLEGSLAFMFSRGQVNIEVAQSLILIGSFEHHQT